MRKVLSIVLLILSFLIIYFIQTNLFSWFTIANVMPNLFVIFILFIGLFAGKKLGLIFGIICGFFLDVVIGRQIGISGIMLGIIGLLGEYLDKNFSKESRITIMLMIATSTAIYEITTVIYSLIQRLGHTLEDIFKTKNILTRYFWFWNLEYSIFFNLYFRPPTSYKLYKLYLRFVLQFVNLLVPTLSTQI